MRIAIFARASYPSTSAVGIRLSEPERLSLLERLLERETRAVHSRQDVVAGAVQDAGDAKQAISRQPLADRANDRNATRHRRLEQQLSLLASRQREQLDAVGGDQLLVGGHDGFPGQSARAG